MLGECLCYKGEPLIHDFRHDSHRLCIDNSEYIWGFSSSLVFIGLVLEVVWCYVCVMLYLLASQRSELIRRGRPTVGVVRTILDLSEALEDSGCGKGDSWQAEKQLKEQLRGCGLVGYVIGDSEKGGLVSRVGLILLPEGVPRKRISRAKSLNRQGHSSIAAS